MDSKNRSENLLGDIPSPVLPEKKPNATKSSEDTTLHNKKIAAIHITLHEATLKKNYGVFPMSLYVKVHCSHDIKAIGPDVSCGTTPKWEKSIVFGIGSFKISDHILIEIYDQGFLFDERIAWVRLPIGNAMYKQHWIELDGKGGMCDGKLCLSMTPDYSEHTSVSLSDKKKHVTFETNVYEDFHAISYDRVPTPLPGEDQIIKLQQREHLNKVRLLQSTFPQFEHEVISSVLEVNSESIDRASNALAELTLGSSGRWSPRGEENESVSDKSASYEQTHGDFLLAHSLSNPSTHDLFEESDIFPPTEVVAPISPKQ